MLCGYSTVVKFVQYKLGALSMYTFRCFIIVIYVHVCITRAHTHTHTHTHTEFMTYILTAPSL